MSLYILYWLYDYVYFWREQAGLHLSPTLNLLNLRPLTHEVCRDANVIPFNENWCLRKVIGVVV